MAISLPYRLREGQIAYAAKVMANFEARLGAFNQAHVDGLGDGDVITLLRLLYEAAVMAGEDGNAEQIVFPDGETLTQKFNAGTLNASLLDSDGLFYFYVDPKDGHLYVTASDSIDEDDFTVDENGHLVYTLDDPENNNEVHTYDLGLVKGDKGDTGTGDMDASVYDPNGVRKDMNPYTGYFTCPVVGWGDYFLTYDTNFDGAKTYYTELGGSYSVATVTPGDAVLPDTYYEKLPATDCLITDVNHTSSDTLTGHIGGNSGHAFVGPSYAATDAAKLAWSEGVITAVAQGDGISGAGNASAWIRLRALGAVPDESIPLMMTFYL